VTDVTPTPSRRDAKPCSAFLRNLRKRRGRYSGDLVAQMAETPEIIGGNCSQSDKLGTDLPD
jgi:hypothetical protein